MSQLLRIYNYMKKDIITKGYGKDLEFYMNIPSLEEMTKEYFFSEYCWVVIHSGLGNKATKNIYNNFWNNGNYDFDAINHPLKNIAIRKTYSRLDKYFNQYKTSEDKLTFLDSLPHIGPKTKYHLAKNLGFNYAKPDRHLERITLFFGYNNVQKFCDVISRLSNDKIKIVDTVIWRFATLHTNYLEILKEINNN